MNGDPDEESIFTRKLIDYEDFVISLMAGKTAEEVDKMKLDEKDLAKARHFARAYRMYGKLDPDVINQNYLKSVAEGAADQKEYEDELKYLDEHGDDEPDPGYLPRELTDNSEYDGRDDEAIAEIAKAIRRGDRANVEEQPVEFDKNDGFMDGELEGYARLI